MRVEQPRVLDNCVRTARRRPRRSSTNPSSSTVSGWVRCAPNRARSMVLAWRSPRLHGRSDASRSNDQEWEVTPIPLRQIPPAGRDDRQPGVARCRAHLATRRCHGPRNPYPNLRPNHGQSV